MVALINHHDQRHIERIKARVQESVDFAENSPYPAATELYTDVYVQGDYPYIHD